MGQRYREQGRDQRQQSYQLSDADRRKIITEDDPRLLVNQAKEVGYSLQKSGLKSAQIRGIFGTVRQIQMDWPLQASEGERWQAYRQLQLLKPKLAYQAKRNPPVTPLAKILTPAIDEVGDDRQRFQNFVDFFEAILAYYVEAGGK